MRPFIHCLYFICESKFLTHVLTLKLRDSGNQPELLVCKYIYIPHIMVSAFCPHCILFGLFVVHDQPDTVDYLWELPGCSGSGCEKHLKIKGALNYYFKTIGYVLFQNKSYELSYLKKVLYKLVLARRWKLQRETRITRTWLFFFLLCSTITEDANVMKV